MPQRNTDNTPHGHSFLHKIYETVFGHKEAVTPRMEKQIAAEQASIAIAKQREAMIGEIQEKIRRLTGKVIEVIPQSEADNLARSMLFLRKKTESYTIGLEDARSIIKSIERHK